MKTKNARDLLCYAALHSILAPGRWQSLFVLSSKVCPAFLENVSQIHLLFPCSSSCVLFNEQ